MSRIEEIAAQLAGYDPKALGVNGVQSFLAQLVQPAVVAQREDAALFDALTDLVDQFGEDAVLNLARGLERRILVGEFSLNRTRQ